MSLSMLSSRAKPRDPSTLVGMTLEKSSKLLLNALRLEYFIYI